MANAHKIRDKSVEDLILDDHREGPLKYHLTDDEKDTVSSPEPDGTTGTCHPPIPLGLSDPLNSAMTTPEVDCSESNEKKEVDKDSCSSALGSKSSTKGKSHEVLTDTQEVHSEGSDHDKERNTIESEDSREVDGNGNASGKKQQLKISKERRSGRSSSETSHLPPPNRHKPVKAVVDSDTKDSPGRDCVSENLKDCTRVIKQYALRGYQADDYRNSSQESDSLEDVRWERPHRSRRNVDQKDNLYVNKDCHKLESEGVKEGSPLVSTKSKTKTEDKGSRRRKNSSPKHDPQSKKFKANNDRAVKSEVQTNANNANESATYETCNGSTQHDTHRKEEKPTQKEREGHQPMVLLERFAINDEVRSHNGPRKKESAVCKREDEKPLGEVSPPVVGPENKDSQKKVDGTEIHKPGETVMENGKSESKTQVKKEGSEETRLDKCENVIWERGKGKQSRNLCLEESVVATQNSHSSTTKN